MHRRNVISLIITIAVIALSASSARADAIRLKASVRPAPDATCLRLVDIAELEGSEARQWADLTIVKLDKPGSLMEIPIQQVRAILDDAGVHWGRVNLSGRKVVIRPRQSAAADAPGAMASVSLIAPDKDAEPAHAQQPTDQLAQSIIHNQTLRGAIARFMTHGMNVQASDLRLAFNNADAELLGSSSAANDFELKPESSLLSDRVVITVRAWCDGRVVRTAQITVRPLLRTRTAVLLRDLRRDEIIETGDFEIAYQWLPPSQSAAACDPDHVAGRLASTRLKTGDVLRDKYVRRRTLIERGDRVIVRCMVGGIVISLQAEARADGAEGDTIEFRKLGERDTFLATVAGRGEAVVDLSR